MNSDLIDLAMAKHHQTANAVLVSETGEESKAVWLPLSQVELYDMRKTAIGTRKEGHKVVLPLVTVTMPERLAIEKGLV